MDEVSFINASGLVTRVGIRRAGRAPLVFFERPEWVRAWFPGYSDEVIELCSRLNALLEPLSDRDRPGLVGRIGTGRCLA